MAQKSAKGVNGRQWNEGFVNIPTRVLESKSYASIGSWSVKLLIDLYSQYRGRNNGDLTAAWTIMSKKGWHSKGTLARSITELLESGLIVKTRQGGSHQPTLYGVTWCPIDECRDSSGRHKLDIKPDVIPLNLWMDEKRDLRNYA